jgi:hypothetical protein
MTLIQMLKPCAYQPDGASESLQLIGSASEVS